MAGDEDRQLTLPGFFDEPSADLEDAHTGAPQDGAAVVMDTEPTDLTGYHEYALLTSGGKDSLACLLLLLDMGVPREKILLHHHLVDGIDDDLMDWPCTEAYCRSLAKAFGLRISFSWKQGGFRGEMLRNNQPTQPSIIPLRDGRLIPIGGQGSEGTRMKFPQVSASLTTRWCSAYCKVGPSDAWFCNDPEFSDGKKRLVITGERAEESCSRAKYKTFERHRKDNRDGRKPRYLDHWRPVHGWSERQIWDIIQRHRTNVHPAYHIGLGRASCRSCIFGSASQWTTLRYIDPKGFNVIASYEQQFGLTIHRLRSVVEQADSGSLLPGATTRWAQIAMSREYNERIFLDDWQLPVGAYGENAGPS